ncbi:MAG: cupin domain-containing protein [Solirubrobacteraceae bacterium]
MSRREIARRLLWHNDQEAPVTVATATNVKSFSAPDDTRTTDGGGRIDFLSLGSVTAGRATYQPGWRWSEHMKPTAGTDLCAMTHVGYVVSGRQMVRMADGTELEMSAGDAFVVGPGHDTWVIGDEPCVTVDFSGLGGLLHADHA